MNYVAVWLFFMLLKKNRITWSTFLHFTFIVLMSINTLSKFFSSHTILVIKRHDINLVTIIILTLTWSNRCNCKQHYFIPILVPCHQTNEKGNIKMYLIFSWNVVVIFVQLLYHVSASNLCSSALSLFECKKNHTACSRILSVSSNTRSRTLPWALLIYI